MRAVAICFPSCRLGVALGHLPVANMASSWVWLVWTQIFFPIKTGMCLLGRSQQQRWYVHQQPWVRSHWGSFSVWPGHTSWAFTTSSALTQLLPRTLGFPEIRGTVTSLCAGATLEGHFPRHPKCKCYCLFLSDASVGPTFARANPLNCPEWMFE